MQSETFYPKTPLKGELFRKMAQRYPGMDPDTMEVLSHIQAASRALTASMNERLASYGLTEGKFYVLAYLMSEGLLAHEAPHPADIAEGLGVTRGTVTGLLDGLERDGYLERHPDSRDRRALTIHMSEKAHRFLDDFMGNGATIFSQLASIEETEKATLIGWLSRIKQAAENARQ